LLLLSLRGTACPIRYHVTKLLLAYGADVDAADKYGWTPLHRAAMMGHIRTATRLVEHGNATVDYGRCSLGHFYRDVNCNENQDGTPLHAAAEAGHVPIIEMLLRNGATIDAMVRPGGSRVVHSLPSWASVLTQGSAPQDKYGWYPLHKAAAAGRTAAALALLDGESDKSPKGVWGGTPLDEAITNGWEVRTRNWHATGT
jgi:ankyrin repeat protein